MPSILYHFLVLAGLLPLHVSTIPSPQAAVAATLSLELSDNITLPPSVAATKFHNTSNYLLPSSYIIPDSDPLIILQINPSGHEFLNLHSLNYLVVRGLEGLVHQTIQNRGDGPLPEEGMHFRWHNLAISVKSHLPGALELTYGTTATLLRGIWEIPMLYGGACEMDMGVFLGKQDAAHYRGHLALSLIETTRETA